MSIIRMTTMTQPHDYNNLIRTIGKLFAQLHAAHQIGAFQGEHAVAVQLPDGTRHMVRVHVDGTLFEMGDWGDDGTMTIESEVE